MTQDGKRDRLFRAIVSRQMIITGLKMKDLSQMLGLGLSTPYAKISKPETLTIYQLRVLGRALKLTDEDKKTII